LKNRAYERGELDTPEGKELSVQPNGGEERGEVAMLLTTSQAATKVEFIKHEKKSTRAEMKRAD